MYVDNERSYIRKSVLNKVNHSYITWSWGNPDPGISRWVCTDRQIDFIIDPERLQSIFVSRARRKRPLPNLLRHFKGSELNPDSFLHFCLKLPGKREGERALFVAHANFSWCEAKIEGRRLTSGAHPESPSDTRNFAVQPPFRMGESEC